MSMREYQTLLILEQIKAQLATEGRQPGTHVRMDQLVEAGLTYEETVDPDDLWTFGGWAYWLMSPALRVAMFQLLVVLYAESQPDQITEARKKRKNCKQFRYPRIG